MIAQMSLPASRLRLAEGPWYDGSPHLGSGRRASFAYVETDRGVGSCVATAEWPLSRGVA
jgi:hypothetical protein